MKTYSIIEVAAMLRLSPERISQVARAMGIGTRLPMRRKLLLSRDDIRAIKNRNTKPGPKPTRKK